MPQSMEIQYSQANIKGDMSNFMKNIENYISKYFSVQNPVVILRIIQKRSIFVPFGMSLECFLPYIYIYMHIHCFVISDDCCLSCCFSLTSDRE